MLHTKDLPISSELLLKLADNFSTPTYAYSESIIRERCQKLQQLFPGLPVVWLYAIKANDNPHLLDIIRDEGFGFDTVSYEEVLLAQKIADEPSAILYTENNMTDDEMKAAIDTGVWLNIGSLDRLEILAERGQKVRCCVRLNLDVGDGHHETVNTGHSESKFGITLDKLEELHRINRETNVTIAGVHTHIGSGIQEPKNLIRAMNVLLENTREFKELDFINFGGGFPIPYEPGEVPFDIDEFGEIAAPLLQNELELREGKIQFWFEPGRWIVGPAGVLLSQVTAVKQQGGISYLGTNTGFNHLLRPLLYSAYHEVRNISKPNEETGHKYHISGNICESGDVLAKNRHLPETQTGDILAIDDAGAYGMTMSSLYNRRALPLELLIKSNGNEKVIRPRQSSEQVVKEYLLKTVHGP